MEGIVLKSTGSWYIVQTYDGELYNCKLRGLFRNKGIRNTNPIAVGDHVTFEASKDDSNVITEIAPRKNYIIRKSINLSKETHIVASNIDQAMLVVTISNPRTSTGFIDRFLVTAEAYSIKTIIVFNKVDTYDDEDSLLLNEMISIYERCGYQCVTCSALRGDNMELIKALLTDQITLLSGHSGVGKSAIINNIDPTVNIKTGAISVAHKKGMHTTTFAEMYPLSFGGYIIDTPGIKEFGLTVMDKWEVSHYFPEMFKELPNCAYNNCTHINEPKCAVKKAVEDGRISESRYLNYLNIVDSITNKYS